MSMRRGVFLLFFLPIFLYAQVEQAVMQQIYEESRTPYKYGMVVAPPDNHHKYDCPTVFRHGDKWLMTYVCYDGKEGNDGRGYETWLAESDDLLHWNTVGRVLQLPDETGKAGADNRQAASSLWDQNQRGGFPALIDYTWGGTYELQTFKDNHWMTYIGGPGTGYEAVNAPLSIGLASIKKDDFFVQDAKNHHFIVTPWNTYNQPILSYNDSEAQWWEQLTQYKSTIYWIKDKQKRIKGAEKYPFVMYYNAGGKDATHPKGERIGIALSKDLKKWKRYDGNPVFAHDSDGTITGDAQLVEMYLSSDTKHQNPVYVMFYFSAFNPTREYNAYNTFAASYDLVNWTDWTGSDLIIPSKPYDEMFAHKSYVVKYNGTVYHFYCAVNNAGQRGIALATSRHVGQSEVHFPAPDRSGHRYVQLLNDNWEITLSPATKQKVSSLTSSDFIVPDHFVTDIPYNLDDYYGALQKEHGNLHGDAVFKKTFKAPDLQGKRYFIRFEGVGTYAEIVLNGRNLGRFDIGRTTETIDVTSSVNRGGDNLLEVNVSHPAAITDMPWVCGGCSSEWGFSEGSQPFGIFRPVVLEITDEVRIEPFGVHVWNNLSADSIFVETELKNYGSLPVKVQLVNKLCEKNNKQIIRLTDDVQLSAGETKIVRQASPISNPKLWSVDNSYLYNLNTIVKRNGKATESTDTPYGISTTSWPLTRNDGDQRFHLNGKPVFINGTCEYEHEFGQSHAFSNEQIAARIKMAKEAGFNAFRDGHQPHNLYYKQLIDEQGLLWWPQFSAHIWYDTPQFRESFKRHLVQWVKERRNSPSIMLWGLQNESTLPKDFAEECCDIIRQMDPRCGTQRLITTCNGGEGSDWNVVQNWSGTYGGDVNNYGNELKRKDQLLNGEYGAWRTLGNHTGENYTEEKFLRLLEKKVVLAESVKDSVCGQFHWLLVSHDNPGRRQPDEALRRVDKVGPFNYKGLFTIWGQPVDAYYMYQDHYNPQPVSPAASVVDEHILTPAEGYTYLYRLNCGGDNYIDEMGNSWMQDNSRWSYSWASRFAGKQDGEWSVSPYQASQTYNDAISSPLFKSSRFGRHDLGFRFPAAPGRYRVELYFIEPWYRQHDAEGLRMFDVAVNGKTMIHNLDLWAQVHYGRPYKRVLEVQNTGREIIIHFPKVNAGQAVIAAIAIAVADDDAANLLANKVNRLSPTDEKGATPTLWADFNNDILVKTPDTMLPPKSSPAMEVEGKLTKNRMEWDFNVGVAKVYALRWKYYNPEKPRLLHVKLTDKKGVVYKDDDITFLQTDVKKTKRKMTSITTGSQINAGTYHVVVTGEGLDRMVFDNLTIE